MVSDNAFLLLEPRKGNAGELLLVAWSFLYSLTRLRKAGPEALRLSWRSVDSPDNECQQTLEIMDGDPADLAEVMVSRLQRLGARLAEPKGVSSSLNKGAMINEDDVTMKSVARMDINEINENIALFESSMEGNLSISAVQTLTLLYQKAIEYYSAMDNPIHAAYVKKLRDLMQSKEVQDLLSPEKKTPTVPAAEEEMQVSVSVPPGYNKAPAVPPNLPAKEEPSAAVQPPEEASAKKEPATVSALVPAESVKPPVEEKKQPPMEEAKESKKEPPPAKEQPRLPEAKSPEKKGRPEEAKNVFKITDDDEDV